MNQIGTVTEDHANGESNIWAGTIKLIVQALPRESGLNLRVGVGPAIITRSGPAYRAVADGRMTGLTDLGGAFSLCTRVPIGRFADIRLRAEDLVYKASQTWKSGTVAGASIASEPRLQHDVIASIGLQLNVTR
jgi:hypothetical protein